MKKVRIILLIILIVVGMTIPSFANNVTFYPGSEDYVESNDEETKPVDLFNISDVMPGVLYYDSVVLSNDASNKDSVKVYLRSEGVGEGEELLSRLYLYVTAESESPLFVAPANTKAQLSDWVYLGTVHPGGEIPLQLALLADPEMGNELAEKVGKMNWEFLVTSIDEPTPGPNPTPTPKPSKTGDYSQIVLYAALLGMCLLMVIVFFSGKKKRR